MIIPKPLLVSSHTTMASRAKGDGPAARQHESEHLGSLKRMGPKQCHGRASNEIHVEEKWE